MSPFVFWFSIKEFGLVQNVIDENNCGILYKISRKKKSQKIFRIILNKFLGVIIWWFCFNLGSISKYIELPPNTQFALGSSNSLYKKTDFKKDGLS